jgi:hypothetical protein
MNRSDPKQVTVWMARAIAYLAYAWLVVTEIILLQGFLLRLGGANPGSSYVDWAYRSLERVMAPFRGIFESIELDGNSVLDTSIIFAMVMYGILAILVRSLLDWLTYRLDRLERTRLLDEAREEADAAAAYGTAGYAAPGTQPLPAASQQPLPAPAAPPTPPSGGMPPPAQ